MDIGCYAISLSRFIFDAEPTRVLGLMERDPGTTSIVSPPRCSSSFRHGDVHLRDAARALSAREYFWYVRPDRDRDSLNAPADQPCRIWLHVGSAPGGTTEEIRFDACDQYTLQADASRGPFSKISRATPLADAVANMQVIERCWPAPSRNME